MKRFWIVFLVLVVVVVGGFALVWRTVDRFASERSVDGGVLVWRVEGGYPDTRDDSIMALLRRGDRPIMREVVFGLERAAGDPRISGLVLDLQGLETDWAKVEELRAGVQRFRAAGKPVLAVITGADTRDYALAAAADRIAMVPEGSLMVMGVAADLLFFAETLGKVGVAADFVHVGDYKSAPEQLTRVEPTPANLEMTRAIVDDQYRRLLDMLATGRGVPVVEAQAWVDSGFFDAPMALAAGLVDTVGYREDLIDGFLPDEEITELADYVRERPSGRTRRGVALIHVDGTIMPGKSRSDFWQGSVAGATTIGERLLRAAEDDDVDAVVLRVDSPGGSALASDEIWHAVNEVRDRKPVVVSMSGYAASGGYYVACAADSVFAGLGTLTGSIGVFAGKLDLSGLYERLGVHRELVARGENVSFFSDHQPFTPAQRLRFRVQLERFYDRFLEKVAAGRGLERDAVHAVAQGRVWTGAQALERGLVDAPGGLLRAMRAAKSLAGIPVEERVAVVTYERQLTWIQRMLLESFGSFPTAGLAGSDRPLPPALLGLRDDLDRGGALALPALMDGQALALPPYHLVVR
ncbi:MAG: signal peptide peptidase SppA [Candidatus Krumholzibacteriia bacterium]